LNFQDIDVRSVLQLLADTSGQNIVVSDSVTGNLTLRLQNVPWDQALDIVLRTKGLDKRRQDNVIIIGPDRGTRQPRKGGAAAHKEVQELSPVHSEFMQVNYAKVADLAKLIKTQANAKDVHAVAARQPVHDERTNTLLVQDTPDRWPISAAWCKTLDVPVKQVLDRSAHRRRQRYLRARFGRPARHHRLHGIRRRQFVLVSGTNAASMTALSAAPRAVRLRPPRDDQPDVGQSLQVNLPARTPTAASACRCCRAALARPGAVGGRERRQERDHFLAAHHHGQPEASHHHARCRNSLPGIGIERRHDHPVQERRAVVEGDPADHA
jgi:type IV pilus assembly protein PilQ